jgi:hypothetical protein
MCSLHKRKEVTEGVCCVRQYALTSMVWLQRRTGLVSAAAVLLGAAS